MKNFIANNIGYFAMLMAVIGFGSGGNEEIMQINGTPQAGAVAPAGILPVARVGSIANVPVLSLIHI